MVHKARMLIPLLIIPVLILFGLLPLWGQEGEEVPLALGFVSADGTTGIAQFMGQVEEQDDTRYGTGYGLPSEPPGHQLVRLTNEQRTNQGRPPLKAARELMNSAQLHGDRMAAHDCASHNCPDEPDWITPIENAGYTNHTALEESVAVGHTTPSAAVNAWMGSRAHRANMLNFTFREAGGGYAFSGTAYYHHYWTMLLRPVKRRSSTSG